MIALFAQSVWGLDPSGNPILKGIFTADPSAHAWADGRLYVYPSHDIAPPRGGTCDLMDDYHVFSTDDMKTWIDHGVVLSSSDLSWGRPAVSGDKGFMWAPDAAYKNGKYYFYFPHKPADVWRIGVAVSTEPASGFKDVGTPMDIGSTSSADFDPAVFVDPDDGRVYLYVGGSSKNENCRGGELNDDMVSLKEPLVPMEGVVDFHEGTFVFKRQYTYYLTYADNNANGNQMRYCTGPSPLGPWQYQGVFFGPCDSGTTHGSIVEYPRGSGEWWLFYHNMALSGMQNLRSVCVARLEFDEDGAIIYQEPDESPRQTPEPAPGGVCKEFLASDRCTPGGGATFEVHGDDEALAGFHIDGTYGEFTGIVAGSGSKVLYIRYASKDGGAFVLVSVNGVAYDAIFAHGNDTWDDFSAYAHTAIELQEGENTIRLDGGHGGINIVSVIICDA